MSESTLRLLKEASRARSEDRLADAHRCLIEAVALCRTESNSPLLLRALKMLGQIERDLGRDDAALPLYEEALLICRAADDALTIAHTVRHVGDIHQDAGRLELAEECYLESLDLYRTHEGKSTLDVANAVRPLAILKQRAGHVAEAKRLWAEAGSLYAAANVREGVAESERRLAQLRG